MECNVIGCPYLEERTSYIEECNLPASKREVCIKRTCDGCPHNVIIDSYDYYICTKPRDSECWNA